MAFERIESEFQVEKLQHKGVTVWPVIKSYLIGITGEFNVIKEATPSNLGILLKNLIPDIFSLWRFKKNQHWVFTNSERRYFINESSFDRVTTGLLNYIEGYLLFENPIPKGRTKSHKLQPGERAIGMSWIFLLQFFITKITSLPIIDNLDALNAFLKKDVSKIRHIYRRILAGQRVYTLLIKVFKPKVIFVVCYYSNFEIIRAANKCDIPVVELQHGLVSEGHRAYYFKEEQPNIFMPDYFLSYGSYSSDLVVKGKVVQPENILNYGFSFLEEVSKNLTLSKELKVLKDRFTTTICITGQLEVTDTDLVAMISDVSSSFPDICFIFKPRFLNRGVQFIEKPNFIRTERMNTYELLKYCDFHLTVYSTCALECLALGTPNISIDIKNYYTNFLRKMLGDNPYNYVANNKGELLDVLRTLESKKVDEDKVKKSIAPIFSPLVDSDTFHTFFKNIF